MVNRKGKNAVWTPLRTLLQYVKDDWSGTWNWTHRSPLSPTIHPSVRNEGAGRGECWMAFFGSLPPFSMVEWDTVHKRAVTMVKLLCQWTLLKLREGGSEHIADVPPVLCWASHGWPQWFINAEVSALQSWLAGKFCICGGGRLMTKRRNKRSRDKEEREKYSGCKGVKKTEGGWWWKKRGPVVQWQLDMPHTFAAEVPPPYFFHTRNFVVANKA